MTERVRVFRGRAGSVETDREVTRDLLDAAADGDRAVRVWTPHRQVAFGRRDASTEGYERARAAARDRGFPPVERRVGGRAVAYDGETTVAFTRAEPVTNSRCGIRDRYDRVAGEVADALRGLGVPVADGEPPDSFCPGTHSLQVSAADASIDGSLAGRNNGGRGKLAGIAQRVTADAALVAGVLLVDRPDALVDVLDAVYAALDLPFDPGSVGSVAGAGGPADPAVVARAIEDALVGEADPIRERLGG